MSMNFGVHIDILIFLIFLSGRPHTGGGCHILFLPDVSSEVSFAQSTAASYSEATWLLIVLKPRQLHIQRPRKKRDKGHRQNSGLNFVRTPFTAYQQTATPVFKCKRQT